jgi:hypothetical protein
MEALPSMSWRRFSVLLSGLSMNSNCALIVRLGSTVKSNPGNEWTEDSGPLGAFKTLTANDLSRFKVVRKGG